MVKNVKFNYLYRDTGNYKSWGEIIFTNPTRLSVDEIDNRLRKSFFHNELFIADQIGIPQVFMYSQGSATTDDHCFHEYDSVELTDEESNDLDKRTIQNFLEQIEMAAIVGWRSFHPQMK